MNARATVPGNYFSCSQKGFGSAAEYMYMNLYIYIYIKMTLSIIYKLRVYQYEDKKQEK